MKSPYAGVPRTKWAAVTRQLVARRPLEVKEIADVVLAAWQSIFDSRMGTRGFQIGVDIFPKPQIMGFFLHELIPLELAGRYPGVWRVDSASGDKDVVYVPDASFSVEIKTSSNPSHIFGNRSYAQAGGASKKTKTGYCLAVNFEKFAVGGAPPGLRLIRFGWLDARDWIGQKAATGQQSRLPPEVEENRFLQIYPAL